MARESRGAALGDQGLSRSDIRRARRSGREEKGLFGVPARFMAPRLVLYVTTFALTAFGLLMIFSSSSITAMTSADLGNDPIHYLQRQLLFCAMGVVASVVLALIDYHILTMRVPLLGFWTATTLLLGAVLFTSSGQDAYGATRWITIPGLGFNLQPSEFAKASIVLVFAYICDHYFDRGDIDLRKFAILFFIGVAIPLLLILVQPDKGSTMICGLTLLVMLYLSGAPGRLVVVIFLVLALAFAGLSLRDDYSRQRFFTMFNPWADPYGNGYQLIQGFYAFGSGGLFGVGIGMSRQKYSYLPMAYNDFIYAVVGEECGLVGTLGVLAGFGLILWASFRIASEAPDLAGRVIAAGCGSMLVIQLFVNILGVLGVFPMTGKPVPFLSYGGSSIISSLILVGLITSVSRSSKLIETEHDRLREDMSVTPGGRSLAGREESGMVGDPVPRSERGSGSASWTTPAASAASRGFKVYDGAGADRRASGSGSSGRGSSSGRSGGRGESGRNGASPRVTRNSRGYDRIDLGPTATDRLRTRDRKR